jgi:GNAT superfamily N-acetyltransferase
MFAAYQDTPDASDAGDTVTDAVREIAAVFDGEYGPMLPKASFIADEANRPVTATLVTFWNGEPLLAYVFTAPESHGQGLATMVIRATMNSLGQDGHLALNLAVTDANARAAGLYLHLGFQHV